MKNKTQVNDPAEQFANCVMGLAVESVNLFKDDKEVRRLVRNGKFKKLIELLEWELDNRPEMNGETILAAVEGGPVAVMALPMEAQFINDLEDLLIEWIVVASAKRMMPSLRWPPGFKI